MVDSEGLTHIYVRIVEGGAFRDSRVVEQDDVDAGAVIGVIRLVCLIEIVLRDELPLDGVGGDLLVLVFLLFHSLLDDTRNRGEGAF